MIKKTAAGLAASFAVAAFAWLSPASAKQTVTMVHPTDPIYEASVWPIQHGKVTSKTIDFKITFTSMQAVIHAVGTQQYDLIPMVTNILPKLAKHGVEAKIICTNQRFSYKGGGSHLYVAASSPIKSVADLKGKTIGVVSLNSSGVTATRVVMSKLFHADVALDGGDFKWVELPMAVLPTALKSGRIDAALLSNQYDYISYNDRKDYRPVFEQGLADALGVAVPTTVVLGYANKLNAHPEEFMEAARMLKASAEYVKTHRNEVFDAVAKENHISPDYMKWYYSSYAEIPYDLTKSDLKGIKAFWDSLVQIHALADSPPVKNLVWDKAVIE